MHIRPYAVLGLATVCAGGSVGVMVANVDPYNATPLLVVLFWGSVFLFIWGTIATLLSMTGGHLTLALSLGFLWALVGLGLGLALRHGHSDWRLSVAAIGATMVLSAIVRWRSHRNSRHA